MRGRKPSSERLKIAKGTRADRLRQDAPQGSPGRPTCPSLVSDDPVALRAWEAVVSELDQLGVLSQSDGGALALYAVTYSRWVEAQRVLKERGLILESRGALKSNPAAAIAAATEERMAKLLSEFGLTPSSRSRLRINTAPPTQDEDDLDEFLEEQSCG